MSERGDSPFARWSRRKLGARSNEDREPEMLPPAEAETEHGAPVPTSAPEPEAGNPPGEENTESTEPLPRLEDLTAESDLTAFLRKGVPKELKSAALRRMWSLDPRIRDYVGPAEYAWDFNQPGSMRGFGALDPGEAVVSFLSKVGRAVVADEQEGTFAERAAFDEQAGDSTEREVKARHDRIADADDQPTAVSAAEPPLAPASGGPEVAEGAQDANPSQRPAARPRHGGAMPR